MKKTILATALASVVLTTWSVAADVRHYVADIESSSWLLEPTSNPLKCELTHQVGWFAKAVFTSEASKQLTLNFRLEQSMIPDTYAQATVYSVPPAWMPGVPSKLLAQMDLQKQFAPELDKELGWTLLTELEKGFWPSFSYQDWYHPVDTINISLNSANFAPAYQEFVGCVGQLLPFSFEDIAFTILTYKNASADLTYYAEKRLAMIAEYLSLAPELELVLVGAYAAPKGPNSENTVLAQQRADTVRDFFTQKGIEPSRVIVNALGDKRQIGQDSVLGNKINRRVVIQLNKALSS
jgi:outer membrane protein OmpA-like peptidoglycan-associated protein